MEQWSCLRFFLRSFFNLAIDRVAHLLRKLCNTLRLLDCAFLKGNTRLTVRYIAIFWLGGIGSLQLVG